MPRSGLELPASMSASLRKLRCRKAPLCASCRHAAALALGSDVPCVDGMNRRRQGGFQPGRSPASDPDTTVLILPITFEPFPGRGDKYSGAIPPAIEPERGMVEAGVLQKQSGIGASPGQPVRVPNTRGLAS